MKNSILFEISKNKKLKYNKIKITVTIYFQKFWINNEISKQSLIK